MELRERPLTAVQGSTEGEYGSFGYRRRFRAYRNGVPEVPYEYRQRRYPWAERAIAAAEAAYGPPRPVCAGCGGPLAAGNDSLTWCRACRAA